jgi:hypothetical protein
VLSPTRFSNSPTFKVVDTLRLSQGASNRNAVTGSSCQTNGRSDAMNGSTAAAVLPDPLSVNSHTLEGSANPGADVAAIQSYQQSRRPWAPVDRLLASCRTASQPLLALAS